MKNQHTGVSRRNFLRVSGAAGLSVLALGIAESALGKAVTLTKLPPRTLALELNPYILLDNTGKITIFNPRPDMGQGTYQSMPTLVAEELEVTLDQITIKQTNGLGKYGGQLSGGSSSVRTRWMPMRKAGAAVKEMLIKAAAQRWQVAEGECYAELAKVFHKPTGRSFSYGELVDDASKLEVPTNPKLKDPSQFRLIGKAIPKPDVPLKVTGKAVFGLDVELPGMLYASVERSPLIHGKVISFDDSKAKAIPGVKYVMKAERAMPHKTVETVAVVATSYWAALQGRKALKVVWDNGDAEKISTEEYYNRLKAAVSQKGNDYADKSGDFDKAFAEATKKVEVYYETPFLAHAPMEPENATVWVKGDTCEIWAPVQGPDGAIQSLAGYLKIKPENVKVNVTFLGGAFGRKAYLDFVNEAAFISKQVNAPIKLIWTREDDTSQGPFRPGMINAFQGGLDANGNIVAFHHKIMGESIPRQVFKMPLDGKPDPWAEEVAGHEDSPMNIPNIKRSHHLEKTEIPIVWWRSVYASTNGFGHESFVDELAHAVGKDPMKLRLELYDKSPRFKKVLETLANKSGWFTDKLPAGKARGVAICRSFSTICAHAVTVSKVKEGVKIEKVVSVIDCGMTVNPDNVRAQTEGNIVYGLTAALKDGITFEKGQAQQNNFHNYQVLRLPEIPSMEIHIIESQEEPGGVGEPGLPPIAPALTNAIFSLTGKRIRKLPFDLARV
ncbi:MAG: molybdopterin cofactor-binding domain-containing protein [Spirosomataceae bacterium]